MGPKKHVKWEVCTFTRCCKELFCYKSPDWSSSKTVACSFRRQVRYAEKRHLAHAVTLTTEQERTKRRRNLKCHHVKKRQVHFLFEASYEKVRVIKFANICGDLTHFLSWWWTTLIELLLSRGYLRRRSLTSPSPFQRRITFFFRRTITFPLSCWQNCRSRVKWRNAKWRTLTQGTLWGEKWRTLKTVATYESTEPNQTLWCHKECIKRERK